MIFICEEVAKVPKEEKKKNFFWDNMWIFYVLIGLLIVTLLFSYIIYFNNENINDYKDVTSEFKKSNSNFFKKDPDKVI